MPYCFDFLDGDVYRWTLARADGEGRYSVDESYTPRLYVDGPTHLREEFAAAMGEHPAVAGVGDVNRRLYFGRESDPVLAVDVTDINAVTRVAQQTRQVGVPSDLRCFNVDFAEVEPADVPEEIRSITRGLASEQPPTNPLVVLKAARWWYIHGKGGTGPAFRWAIEWARHLATDTPRDVKQFDEFLTYLVVVGFADEKASLR